MEQGVCLQTRLYSLEMHGPGNMGCEALNQASLGSGSHQGTTHSDTLCSWHTLWLWSRYEATEGLLLEKYEDGELQVSVAL